jgi:hypothetical protein
MTKACIAKIPEEFFQEDFVFSPQYLTKEREKMNGTQENVNNIHTYYSLMSV